jgi:hypothetical protein
LAEEQIHLEPRNRQQGLVAVAFPILAELPVVLQEVEVAGLPTEKVEH